MAAFLLDNVFLSYQESQYLLFHNIHILDFHFHVHGFGW